MGEIEVIENGDFISYGDLLCTLVPLEQQRPRQSDETGPNAPDATPYDPPGTFHGTPSGMERVSPNSGFHSPLGGGSATMRERPMTTENLAPLESTRGSTTTPDWSRGSGNAEPVASTSGIPGSFTPSEPLMPQSDYSVRMPICMPHMGGSKGALWIFAKKKAHQ